jgi:starvation-inducible DNA-binding protein
MNKLFLMSLLLIGTNICNGASSLPPQYEQKFMTPLKKEDTIEIAKQLNILMASTDALCIKTRGFTANLITPDFYEFHNFFNNTVKYLQEASYDISERVRSIGQFANTSLRDIQQKSKIEDASKVLTNPMEMVNVLFRDYIKLSTQARGIFRMAASVGDAGTIALATKTTNQLEHFGWELGVMASGSKVPQVNIEVEEFNKPLINEAIFSQPKK